MMILSNFLIQSRKQKTNLTDWSVICHDQITDPFMKDQECNRNSEMDMPFRYFVEMKHMCIHTEWRIYL